MLNKTIEFFDMEDGKPDWVGPDYDSGVCDDCEVKHKDLTEHSVVRRIVAFDNLYLCRTHWDMARMFWLASDGKDTDPVDIGPFNQN